VAFSNSDKILIVGANSSLASALLPQVTRFTADITGVFRKKPNADSTKFQQKVFFDLADVASIENLIRQLSPQRFQYIYIFVGATSNIDTKRGLITAVSEYYDMYGARLNYIFGNLENCLSVGGTMIFLSSRAAHRSSYDAHYSAAKSSNEGFLISLSAQTEEKRILILAPSLIENSTMYTHMSDKTIDSHRERTGNQLLALDEVVDVLIDMSMNKVKYPNGSIECIGRDW
jgi:NAD(P)-dependent dehydrogenase (short-subunit alcohol dehydrogenase family)